MPPKKSAHGDPTERVRELKGKKKVPGIKKSMKDERLSQRKNECNEIRGESP
jgi:hypothetical protein